MAQEKLPVRNQLLFILAASCSSIALANQPAWTISETTGAVQVSHAGMVKIGARGTSVAGGDTITTGPGGRAVLTRGTEYMMVAASSRLRLPQDEQATGFTQVIQEVGNVVFMIKRKMTPHFEVKTPYLAAVVKGTTFSVSVSPQGASVQVLEGAVDVATKDGGAHDLLRPGNVAVVGAQDLHRMRVEADGLTRVLASPAAAPDAGQPTIADTGKSDTAVVTTSEPPVVATAVHEAPVSLAAVTNGLVKGSAGGQADLGEVATVTRTASETSMAAVKVLDTATRSMAAGEAQTSTAIAVERADQATEAAQLASQQGAEAAARADAAAKAASDAAARANADKLAQDASSAAARMAADAADKAAAAALEDARLAEAVRVASEEADVAARANAQQAAALAAQAARDAASAVGDPAAQAAADKAARDAAKAADDAVRASAAAAQAQADKAAKEAAKAAKAKDAEKAARDAAKAAADAAQAAADQAAKLAEREAKEAAKAAAETAAALAKAQEQAAKDAKRLADEAAKAAEDAAKAAQKASDDAAKAAEDALKKLKGKDK